MRCRRSLPLLIPLVTGTLLCMIFWPTLWLGHGLIGGDTYTYFFPQKAFLADRLHAGEFPLWNNRFGHGYPLLGESQTAALYPLNPLLYGLLDLNTAYLASHLLHYVVAFAGMWWFARRLQLHAAGALLAATVFTYSWFPPRACLEWAIIGGAYLPLTLAAAESAFQTGKPRYLALLSCLFGLDLLAGHYNLAFITTLAVGVYSVGRAWLKRPPGETNPQVPQAAAVPSPLRIQIGVLLAVALGFGLAAPQLGPTLALKQSSQRNSENAEFLPGYGHVPPWYLCQMVTPWLWFGGDADPDRVLNRLTTGSIAAATNKVEAHLYFGLLPLGMAILGLVAGRRRPPPRDPRWRCLFWLGLFGLVYATGWLLPLFQHLPGFGYFRGPGRFGILPTLAVALFAGRALHDWTQARTFFARWTLTVLCVGITVVDLWLVSRHPWYVVAVSDPPIRHRDESPVGRLLARETFLPRLLAPGPNLATLTGHAATPPYLGFGPNQYYATGGHLPDPKFLAWLSGDPSPTGIDIPAQFVWMRQAGVTHLLSMKPLPASWPITLVWSGFDPLLNRAWARQQPLYLYSVAGAQGRAWLVTSAGDEARLTPVSITAYAANRVAMAVELDQPAELNLADLDWPGWQLQIDGLSVDFDRPAWTEAEIAHAARLRRSVLLEPGRHDILFEYRDRAFEWGLVIAALSLAGLAALCIGWGRLSPHPLPSSVADSESAGPSSS